MIYTTIEINTPRYARPGGTRQRRWAHLNTTRITRDLTVHDQHEYDTLDARLSDAEARATRDPN